MQKHYLVEVDDDRYISFPIKEAAVAFVGERGGRPIEVPHVQSAREFALALAH